MPANILRQLIHGAVAPGRVFFEGLQDNVVQITGQTAPQALGRFTALNSRLAGGATGQNGARRKSFLFRDHLQHLLRSPRLELHRAATREELVENDAERVDIAGHGNRLTANLLGACVVGRQQTVHRRGYRDRQSLRIRRNELGDTEVEQSRRAVLRHQDVVRFEVTVDHESQVGELHGVADGEEEAKSPVDIQTLLVAVREQRPSDHVVHHQKWAAVRRRAAIDEPGDERVIQHREDLALRPEPLQYLVRAQAGIDQLDRDFLREVFVVARRSKDNPHPAAARFLDDPVRTDLVPGGKRANQVLCGGSGQEAAGTLMRGDQGTNLADKIRLRGGCAGEYSSRAAGAISRASSNSA